MTKSKMTLACLLAVVVAPAYAEVTYKVSMEYDDLGRLVRRVGNNGQVVSYTYDDEDRVTSITDAQNRKTTMAYDARGRVIQSVDALAGTSGGTYDSNDRLVSVTDPRGKVTTYENDGFGQTWSTTRLVCAPSSPAMTEAGCGLNTINLGARLRSAMTSNGAL
jgi:YD repeat-containing protein